MDPIVKRVLDRIKGRDTIAVVSLTLEPAGVECQIKIITEEGTETMDFVSTGKLQKLQIPVATEHRKKAQVEIYHGGRLISAFEEV